MATFPALEPTRRGYGITGELPMVVETAWPASNVRFRTGFQPLTTVGMPLRLDYADLRDSEAQQIRNHYAVQMAGTIPFALPAVIFQGHATALTPAGIQWRYVDAPAETHKRNGRIDLTVNLEAMAFTMTEPPPPLAPIAATYSQSSVYSGNAAATEAGMTNGVFAEATQTGTNNGGTQWVRMDFGSPTAFNRIIVGADFDNTLAGGWGKSYTQNRDIQGSNDASAWTTIINTGTFSQGIQEYSTPGETWRYVRITSGSDYLAITEFYASL